MATESFGKKKGAAPSAEPASVENDGATPKQTGANTDTTVSTDLRPPNKSGFVGAWTLRDVRLPRLNLIHKTSKEALIAEFGIGSFAFNKEIKMSDGKTPIIITALVAGKDYQQKLAFGSPDRPDICETPEEVELKGGTVKYSRAAVAEKTYYGPRAHIQFITPLPEGTSEEGAALFPYGFEGVSYAMAITTVASSAFTSVGKELATLCNNNKVMRKGMEFGRLELTSESHHDAVNEWRIPVIKYAGENPAALVKFFQSLL
jgi:hypothetical protein